MTTEREKQNPLRVEALEIMYNHPETFDYEMRLETHIWAARSRSCQKCGAPPRNPCINLGVGMAHRKVPTKWPHEPRIDWALLISSLRERGYCRDGEKAQEG